MANTFVPFTADASKLIDAFTETTNGHIRQAIVIADPSTDAAVAPVSATLGVSVNVTNATLPFTEAMASTATLANVSASASSVTLQAANANRRGLEIFNDSTVRLYYKAGTTASTTSFTGYLEAGESRVIFEKYTGIVHGIWTSATGTARMTEYTI